MAAVATVAILSTAAQAVTTGYSVPGLRYSSNFNSVDYAANPGTCTTTTWNYMDVCDSTPHNTGQTGWDMGAGQAANRVRDGIWGAGENMIEGDGLWFAGTVKDGGVGYGLHNNGTPTAIQGDGSDGYKFIQVSFQWRDKNGPPESSEAGSRLYFKSPGGYVNQVHNNSTVALLGFTNSESGADSGEIFLFDRNDTNTDNNNGVTIGNWKTNQWHKIDLYYGLDCGSCASTSGKVFVNIRYADDTVLSRSVDTFSLQQVTPNNGLIGSVNRIYYATNKNHGVFMDELEFGVTNAPEPATLGLMMVGAMAVLGRRRRA
jgi:hypothetical protein